MSDNITIVTGYFTIPSKFTNETYLNWIKNFLSLNCKMIIFTDEKNYKFIKSQRSIENTYLIKIELNEFVTYKHIDYWNYCKSIDREEYHTPELYMIWAEKTYFLEKAINLNPFKCDLFFWSDMGCIRDTNQLQYISTFPNYQKFQNYDLNKFFLSSIAPFKLIDPYFKNGLSVPLLLKDGKSPDIINRIQGGFLGGSIECIKNWVNLYTNELNFFIENKYFGGKDQYIFINIYLKNKEQFNLLEPFFYKTNEVEFNEWFSFLYRFN
jgi:hypothetical protein